MPREEWKCKCQKRRTEVVRRSREHLPGPSKETPKTSAHPINKAKRENLTLHDWMTVYSYVDSLPRPINQGRVVRYFATRPQGALLFSQATLSRKLQQRTEMEARVESIPNALSSKRPCVVTRPDVDCALALWVQEMNRKGEVVNSAVSIVRATARDDIEIIDSDSDDDGPIAVPPPLNEVISACRMIEENGLLICSDALDVVEVVRQFRGRLQKMSRGTEKQSTIDMFFIHN